MRKALYHVSDCGTVRPATDEDHCDGINSVLVLSYDADDAVRVARLYDDGVLPIDNHADPSTGITHACVLDVI